MEHRYRLEQPASREQIVAIIRQRAERNRERGGAAAAIAAAAGNPDRDVEARIERRNAAIERRRFQAGIAAMEPPNDQPPLMGPIGPMGPLGGANGVDLMAPPPANVRLERIRGMQGRREEALRGGLEVGGDLAAIGSLIRQASIAKEEDAPRSRHMSVDTRQIGSVLSFQPEVAAPSDDGSSVHGIYVGGKVLSPEANYFEVDVLDKGTSSIHLTFSIGLVSRLFSLDSLPGRVNDSLAFCPGDGFLFRGKDVGSPFGSRADVGDKIGCGLRFNQAQQKKASASGSAASPSEGHIFFTLNSKEFGAVPINIPPGGLFPAISISSPGESLALRSNLRFIKEEDIIDMMVDNCDEDWTMNDVRLNGPVLEYIGKGKTHDHVGLAQAKHAISTRHHYFEIEIIDPGLRGYIAIGLARKDYPKNRHPGWNRGSIAYHADDGKVFVGSGVGAPFGPRCTKGDIMGCGVLFPRNYEYRSDSDDEIEAAASGGSGSAVASPAHLQAGQNPFLARPLGGDGELGDLGGVYYSSDSAADDEDWWSDRNYLPYGAKVNIYFTRNGNIIGKREVRIPKGGFYPTVGMMSSEEKVRVDLRPLSG